jgi:Ran GTPase-activating protein (RanGAP) involved in mRNA processing and transport/GTPase SAR1 family protein
MASSSWDRDKLDFGQVVGEMLGVAIQFMGSSLPLSDGSSLSESVTMTIRRLQNLELRERGAPRVLDLHNQKVSSSELKKLIDEMRRTHVLSLRLSNSKITSRSASVLANYLAESPPLKHLVLACNSLLTDAGISLLLREGAARSTRLSWLDLSRTRVGDQGCESVGYLLAHSRSLQRLDLAQNMISSVGVHRICDAVRERVAAGGGGDSAELPLVSLSLKHNARVGSDGAAALAGLFNALPRSGGASMSLRTLRLGDCGLGADGVHTLLVALSTACAEGALALDELSIEQNQVGSRGDGVAGVATLLRQATSLRTLCLANNALGSRGLKTLVADGLARNTTLRALDLDTNNISDSGVRELAELLASRGRSPASLHSLNLRNNAVTQRGAVDLFGALLRNVALERLQLERNRIGGGGSVAALLPDVFRHNHVLASLDISNNAMSNDVVGALVREIHRSYSLVRFRYTGPPQLADTCRRSLEYNSAQLLNAQLATESAIVSTVHATYQQRAPLLNMSHAPLGHLSMSFGMLGAHLTELVLFKCALRLINDATLRCFAPLLRVLVLRANMLEALPPSIGELRALETLDVADNRLRELPPTIERLAPTLRHLDVSFNFFRVLPTALGALRGLRQLCARDNMLETLPSQLAELVELESADFDQNGLSSIPASVLRSASSSSSSSSSPSSLSSAAAASSSFSSASSSLSSSSSKVFCTRSSLERLRAYLTSIASDAGQPNERVKLMFCGDENQGKTSLMNALKESFFTGFVHGLFCAKPTATVATDGIDISEIEASGGDAERVIFNSWDYAGQQIFYTTHQFFLSSRAIYVVCFNAAEHDSAKIDYWVNTIRLRSGDSPIVLVGTHLDMVSSSDAAALRTYYAEKYVRRIHSCVMISSENRSGVNSLRRRLVQIAVDEQLVGQLVPQNHLAFVQQLIDLRATRNSSGAALPFMAIEEFIAFASGLNIERRHIPQLLAFLSDTGVCLWFGDEQSFRASLARIDREREQQQEAQPHECEQRRQTTASSGETTTTMRSLSELVILDAQFIANLLGTIVTFKHRFTARGFLNVADLQQIWKGYPRDIHSSLLELLVRFEVIHPLSALASDRSAAGDRYLVPFMLPPERPADVDRLFDEWARSAPMHFGRVFQHQFVSLAFFGRFLIRLLAWRVDMLAYWANGVLVQLGADERALIQFSPFTYRLSLYVRSRSSEARSPLLRIVLEAIVGLTDGWVGDTTLYRLLPCTHCLLHNAFAGMRDQVAPSRYYRQWRPEDELASGKDQSTPTPQLDHAKSSSDIAPRMSPMRARMRHSISSYDVQPVAGSIQAVDVKPALVRPEDDMIVAASSSSAACPVQRFCPQSKERRCRNNDNDDDGDDDDDDAPTRRRDVENDLFDVDKVTLFRQEDVVEAITEDRAFVLCHRYYESDGHGDVSRGTPVRVDMLAPDLAINAAGCRIEEHELAMGDKLGQGGFASVFRATWRDMPVAAKVLLTADGDGSASLGMIAPHQSVVESFDEFQREAWLMSGLSHPNLVRLLGVCIKPLAIVMEFVPLGSLDSVLKRDREQQRGDERLSWGFRLRVAVDVSAALHYLHSTVPVTIHRDVKSPNVLVQSFGEGAPIVAKLCDLGSTGVLAPTLRGRQTFCSYWLAPEILNDRAAEYDQSIDVYALGIVMHELLTSNAPFAEYDEQYRGAPTVVFEEAVVEGLRPSVPASAPPPYAALMQQCWARQPSDRPSAQQCLVALSQLL